jgi:SulP family sulfate permease
MLNRSSWITHLTAGLVIGVQLPIYAVVSAVLLGLADVGQAIGMAMISTFLILLFAIFFSKSDKIINETIGTPLILMAVMFTSMVTEFNQLYPHQNLVPTLMMTILISSLSIGCMMFVFGLFKLGKYVKIFPYPVIGGFFAAFGWCIFKAGLDLLTNSSLTLKNSATLFTGSSLIVLLPSLIAGYLLYLGLKKVQAKWFFLAYCIFITAIFYAALYISGIDTTTAQFRGYLFHLTSLNNLIPKLGYLDIASVHWSLIKNHAVNIFFLCLIVLCDIFIRFSGFEIISKNDISANDELKFLGLSNILIGFAGGVPSYISMPTSIMNYKLGGDARVTGFVGLIVLTIVLLSGTTLLNLTPKMIIAVILFYIGFGTMKEWMIDIRKFINKMDYFLLLGVFLISILRDIFTGILAGIIISAVLFLIRYCNLAILDKKMQGAKFRSHVDYSPMEEHLLSMHDDAIHVVQLKNYLFFGNIMQLSESLKDIFSNPKIRFIIIDFKQVTGEDVSVHNSLVRLLQAAKLNNIEMIFSNIDVNELDIITKFSSGIVIKNFESLDLALEYCETTLIEASELTTIERQNFTEQLNGFLKNNDYAQQLAPLFRHEQMTNDTLICRQGEDASEFYFVTHGCVNVYLVNADGSRLRVSKIKSGAFTGEMGYFLKQVRSAEIRAGSDVILYKLAYKDFELFATQNPAAALAFLNYLCEKMAKKLDATNKLLLAHG